jgi:prevent-host-death family protein
MILVIIMTMILVNIYEAKAKLSEYLDAVAKGERVLICKRNQPIAELRAVEQKRTAPRVIGGGPYHFEVPDSFFEPMPDDFLDPFESGPVFPEATPAPSRVAEARSKYEASRRPKKRR